MRVFRWTLLLLSASLLPHIAHCAAEPGQDRPPAVHTSEDTEPGLPRTIALAIEASRLFDAALNADEAGNTVDALSLAQRSLDLFEDAIGRDHTHLLWVMHYIAVFEQTTGRYGDAIAMTRRTLAIAERAYGPRNEDVAHFYTHLSFLYAGIGQITDAEAAARRALEINERLLSSEDPGLGWDLAALAQVLRLQGRYEDALPLVERLCGLRLERLDSVERPRCVDEQARLFDRLNDRRAPDRYRDAIAEVEAEFGPEHPRTGAALLAYGAYLVRHGNGRAALAQLYRAERLLTTAQWREEEWLARYEICLVLADDGQSDLAIFWGKQALNTIQSLRAELVSLERELQEGFLVDKRALFRRVADLLIDAGRLPEAQQVLSMLKEEELHEFLRREAAEDPRDARAAFLGPVERAADVRWRELSSQLARLGRERGELQRQARQGLSEEQKSRLSDVDRSLREGARRYDAFVAGLTEEFAEAGAARSRELGARQLDNLITLQDELRELGGDTVLLHYVVTEKRVAIIVTTAEVQVARESPVNAAELNRRVQALRAGLQDRGKVLAQAQALYKSLIAPVAADLEQAKAKNLALSLDGALRYVPFAALHDGKRFLVERYALSVYTEAARANLRRSPTAHWAMTGLGLTHAVPGFSALPAVRTELEGIRGRIMPGEVYLDDQFTAQRLAESLDKRVPVLHIASHFSFRPGTDADSFLVLGDGSRLTLQDMRERRLRFGAVELLTLSACDTAMGGGRNENGAEVESFGALAQRQGAQAVLATLWPVADESTGVFMREMYRERLSQAGTSKAEALRQVQLAFLQHTGSAAKLPAYTTHPFFWAPFILMGNWL